MTIWERLKPQISCYYDRVVCPTKAQLDAYEAQHHFKLPTSYRQFALTFGSGIFFTAQNKIDRDRELVMPGLVNIFPYYDPAHLSRALLNTESVPIESPEYQAIKNPLPIEESWFALTGDLPRLKRLVFFAHQYNEHGWGWDPEDVTDPTHHEYGIYQMLSGYEGLPRVATSFTQYILETCCQGALQLDNPPPPPDREPDDYPVKFHPVGREHAH